MQYLGLNRIYFGYGELSIVDIGRNPYFRFYRNGLCHHILQILNFSPFLVECVFFHTHGFEKI